MSSSADVEQVPLTSWTGPVGPLLVAPVIGIVAVALFAPLDVLDLWPLAKLFTDAMVASMPWLSGHADSTSYPQVARLTWCAAVALLPWTTAVWIAQSIFNYPRLLANQRRNRTVSWRSALFVLFGAIPVMLIGAGLAIGLPGDPSWATGLTTGHRGALAFMAGSLVYGGGMVLGGAPLMFRLLIDLRPGTGSGLKPKPRHPSP